MEGRKEKNPKRGLKVDESYTCKTIRVATVPVTFSPESWNTNHAANILSALEKEGCILPGSKVPVNQHAFAILAGTLQRGWLHG